MEKKSETEVGQDNLCDSVPKVNLQTSLMYWHSRNMWQMISSTFWHKTHHDGPFIPLFCKFSEVRIFLWTKSQQKKVYLWHVISVPDQFPQYLSEGVGALHRTKILISFFDSIHRVSPSPQSLENIDLWGHNPRE
jgi:hypothetical protein